MSGQNGMNIPNEAFSEGRARASHSVSFHESAPKCTCKTERTNSSLKGLLSQCLSINSVHGFIPVLETVIGSLENKSDKKIVS